MCDKESFAKIRDAIADLQKADAVQSEQIKTLFAVTKKQGEQQDRLTSRLVWAAVVALFLALLAVIYGALGERGFNGVTKAAPSVITQTGGTP